MAITDEGFFGCECGGSQEVALGTGNYTTSPAPWTSKESYICRLDWKESIITPEFAPGTNWVTVSFPVLFQNPNQSSANMFFAVRHDAPWYHIWLTTKASSTDLEVRGVGDVVLATVTGALKSNTWQRITLKFKLTDTSDVKLWIADAGDPDPATPDVDLTSKDCYHNSAPDRGIELRFYNEVVSSPDNEVMVGSCYWRSDDGVNIDTEDSVLGLFTVIGPYNNSNQAAAADFDDTLEGGRWDDTQDVPAVDGDLAVYNVKSGDTHHTGAVNCDDGTAREGPKGDTRIDGTLIAQSGIWRAKKNNNRATVDYYGRIGASPDLGGDGTAEYSLGTLTTSFQNFQKILGGISSDMMKNNYAQLGFRVDATFGHPFIATACQTSGMWCFFLHQEPAAERRLITDGFSQMVAA